MNIKRDSIWANSQWNVGNAICDERRAAVAGIAAPTARRKSVHFPECHERDHVREVQTTYWEEVKVQEALLAKMLIRMPLQGRANRVHANGFVARSKSFVTIRAWELQSQASRTGDADENDCGGNHGSLLSATDSFLWRSLREAFANPANERLCQGYTLAEAVAGFPGGLEVSESEIDALCGAFPLQTQPRDLDVDRRPRCDDAGSAEEEEDDGVASDAAASMGDFWSAFGSEESEETGRSAD